MSQESLAMDYEEKKVTRHVNVKLQPHEIRQYGEQAAEIHAELLLTEEDYSKGKKALKDEYEPQIKKNTAERNRLLKVIDERVEGRDELCTQKFFYSTNTVQVFFGEEMIEERALTKEEMEPTFGEIKHGPLLDQNNQPVEGQLPN